MSDLASPTAAEEFSEMSEGAAPPSRSKSIFWNFASLGTSAAFSRFAGLITNAVLARRISTSGYGMTGIAQTATLYFGLLSDLGLGVVAVREAAQHPEGLQRVMSAMMGLRLVLAITACLLGLVVAPHLPFSESSRSLFRFYLLTLPIQALSVDWVFRAVQRMYWNTVLEIASATLTLILTVMLVRQQSQILRVAGITAAAAATTAFLGILVLTRLGYHARPVFSIAEAKYFLGQSLPFCASTLAFLLYAQSANLILGALRGEADVGLYGAAVRLSQMFYQWIWLYFMAMAPALMQDWAYSAEKARELLLMSVRLTAIASIGFGLIASSMGSWLLVMIFGKPFSQASQAFEIMIWTGIVFAIGHNWGELAVAAKRNRLLIHSTFLGAFVNLAVCAATVPRMGIRGAALSNLFAEIAVHGFRIHSFGWHLGFKPLERAARPALAGAGAYAISLAMRWSPPPICAIVSVCSFVGLLFLMGEITVLDVKRLRRIISFRRVALETHSF